VLLTVLSGSAFFLESLLHVDARCVVSWPPVIKIARLPTRDKGGGEADDAGFQAALNEQMEKVKLAAGR